MNIIELKQAKYELNQNLKKCIGKEIDDFYKKTEMFPTSVTCNIEPIFALGKDKPVEIYIQVDSTIEI